MPVRVEKWLVDGKIKYRVYGIAWGGVGDTGPGSVSSGESPAGGTTAGPGLIGGATGAGVGAE